MYLIKTISKKSLIVFVTLCLVFVITFSVKTSIVDKIKKTSTLIISTKKFNHQFIVELADTKIKRSRGLQGRESLDMNKGMLFNFFKPTYITMWMKQTKISLDMIFIKKNGEVTKIVTNTIPYSENIIHSDKKVNAVLEINGGRAEELKIKKGDYIRHNIFN